MSIDPIWLSNYQKERQEDKIIISDYMCCLELEEALEVPFDEDVL